MEFHYVSCLFFKAEHRGESRRKWQKNRIDNINNGQVFYHDCTTWQTQNGSRKGKDLSPGLERIEAEREVYEAVQICNVVPQLVGSFHGIIDERRRTLLVLFSLHPAKLLRHTRKDVTQEERKRVSQEKKRIQNGSRDRFFSSSSFAACYDCMLGRSSSITITEPRSYTYVRSRDS